MWGYGVKGKWVTLRRVKPRFRDVSAVGEWGTGLLGGVSGLREGPKRG